MAGIFSTNVTQTIDPAQPNVATLGKGLEAKAEGARLSANATGAMLKAAGFLAEQYVAYDVGKTQVEAEELTSEFYKKGVAEETLPIVQAQRDAVAAQGTSYSIQPNAAMRKQAALGTYDEEIKKLKDAVNGGMSNEQYVTRVSALTRKAIAKYPGLADSIREKVATITGLPYADRYKEMEYAKARFAKEAKADSEFDPMKLVVKDIDDMSKVGTFGSREELFTLYNKDRPTYDARRKAFNENLAIETGVKRIKNEIEGQQAASDVEANTARGGFVTMFNGYLGMSVNSASSTNLENVYKPVLALMAKGEDIKLNPAAFDTQIKMHSAQMKTDITAARNQTLAAVERYFASNPNISEPKRQQLKADINSAADLEMAMYADDKGVGLSAMSVIMSNYRDKSLKEQRDLITLVIQQQSAMQNNSLVMAYWAGGEQRKNLELTNKDFYNHMVKVEKITLDATNGITSNTAGVNSLREVSTIIEAAGKDPAAVPVVANADPENTKAAHAVMQSNSEVSLNKATKGTILDVTEVNGISAAQATNMSEGANSQILANDYKKIGDKIRLLSVESQAVIKENVSRAARGNVMSMISMKEMLEAKHGVTITLGVTPTGQIVAMPTPLTKEEQAQQKALGLTKIPLNDIRRKEPAAIDEFNKQSKAKLSNLVFGTAMLVPEKDPVTLANEFATIINNKQAYDGFYNNAPVAPTAVTPFMGGMPGFDEAGNPISTTQPAAPAPAVAAPVSSDALREKGLAGNAAMQLQEERAAAQVTSNAPVAQPTNKPSREASGKLIDETKRLDGTTKGNGYLGVLKASDGSDVTEFSTSTSDFKVKGKEVLFPIIVPGLTKEELKLLLTDVIPNKKRIPDAIYKKAVDHAKKRIKEGKNVFAEAGDYKPADIIAPKRSSLYGQRPDLQPDATSNAPTTTSTTKKWWQ